MSLPKVVIIVIVIIITILFARNKTIPKQSIMPVSGQEMNGNSQDRTRQDSHATRSRSNAVFTEFTLATNAKTTEMA